MTFPGQQKKSRGVKHSCATCGSAIRGKFYVEECSGFEFHPLCIVSDEGKVLVIRNSPKPGPSKITLSELAAPQGQKLSLPSE